MNNENRIHHSSFVIDHFLIILGTDATGHEDFADHAFADDLVELVTSLSRTFFEAVRIRRPISRGRTAR